MVFHLDSGADVVFNDPRRFGVMDLLAPGELEGHPSVGALGPEPLSDAFDDAALAGACAGKRTSLKAALLDQRVVAGLGNIYVVEALHLAGLAPHRRASTIATPGGAPRDAASRLTAAIKQVLGKAIDRQSAAELPVGSLSRLRPRGSALPPAAAAAASSAGARRADDRRSTVRSVSGSASATAESGCGSFGSTWRTGHGKRGTPRRSAHAHAARGGARGDGRRPQRRRRSRITSDRSSIAAFVRRCIDGRRRGACTPPRCTSRTSPRTRARSSWTRTSPAR